jgi:hypothetical protein
LATDTRAAAASPDAAAAPEVDGAVAEAQAVPVTITVADDGGNLKAMRRMDRAPWCRFRPRKTRHSSSRRRHRNARGRLLRSHQGDDAGVASFAPGRAWLSSPAMSRC